MVLGKAICVYPAAVRGGSEGVMPWPLLQVLGAWCQLGPAVRTIATWSTADHNCARGKLCFEACIRGAGHDASPSASGRTHLTFTGCSPLPVSIISQVPRRQCGSTWLYEGSAQPYQTIDRYSTALDHLDWSHMTCIITRNMLMSMVACWPTELTCAQSERQPHRRPFAVAPK